MFRTGRGRALASPSLCPHLYKVRTYAPHTLQGPCDLQGDVVCASFLSPINREQMSVVLLLMMPGTVAACTEWLVEKVPGLKPKGRAR